MTPRSFDTLTFGEPVLSEVGTDWTKFTWPDGFYLIEHLDTCAMFDPTIRDRLVEFANAKRAALAEAGLI